MKTKQKLKQNRHVFKNAKKITNKTFAVDKLKNRHDTYQKYI